jgi:hypothetical protein
MDSDSTLIGMNVSETSKLDIYLENQKLEKIQHFVWFDYIRPLNKQDIFNWRSKKAEDQLKKNVRGPVELPNQHLFETKKE